MSPDPDEFDFDETLLDPISTEPTQTKSEENAFVVEETHHADPSESSDDLDPKPKNNILNIKIPDLDINEKADVLCPAYAAECIKIINAIPDVWRKIDEIIFGISKNLDHLERQIKTRESFLKKQIYDEIDADKKKIFSNSEQRDHAFFVRRIKDKDWTELNYTKDDYRFKLKEFQRQQGRLEHIFKAKRITLRYLSKGGT